MNCLKKLLVCLLVCAVSSSVVLKQSYAEEVLTQDDIEAADEYVEVEDGQLVINDEEELIEEIGDESQEYIEENLEICNQLIDEGIIGLKKNGTLYLLDDDSLTIQGGNINRTSLYWWGFNRYNSYKNTNEIIKEFNKQAANGKAISNSKFVSLIGMMPVFGTLIKATSNVSGILGSGFSSLASAYKSKNKSYGTITKVYWTIVGSSISSQTKNTK